MLQKPEGEGDEWVPDFIDRIRATITTSEGNGFECETLPDENGDVTGEVSCDGLPLSASYEIHVVAEHYNENNQSDNQWIVTHQKSITLLSSEIFSNETTLEVELENNSGIYLDEFLVSIPDHEFDEFALGTTPYGNFKIMTRTQASGLLVCNIDSTSNEVEIIIESPASFIGIGPFPPFLFVNEYFIAANFTSIFADPPEPPDPYLLIPQLHTYSDNDGVNKAASLPSYNADSPNALPQAHLDSGFGKLAVIWNQPPGGSGEDIIFGDSSVVISSIDNPDEFIPIGILGADDIAYPKVILVSDKETRHLFLLRASPNNFIFKSKCDFEFLFCDTWIKPVDNQLKLSDPSLNVFGDFSFVVNASGEILLAYVDRGTNNIYIDKLNENYSRISTEGNPLAGNFTQRSNPVLFNYGENKVGLLFLNRRVSEFDLSLARVDNDGNLIENSMDIVTTASYNLNSPQIAISDDGLALIAWIDGSDDHIYFRRYIF